MDVARAPMGYRDVPSGRAFVAGEFVRVARLCRARMAGQAFLVPFVAIDKRDSPEGAKQDGRADSERRVTPSPKPLGGVKVGEEDRLREPSHSPPNEKMPFPPDRETASFLK